MRARYQRGAGAVFIERDVFYLEPCAREPVEKAATLVHRLCSSITEWQRVAHVREGVLSHVPASPKDSQQPPYPSGELFHLRLQLHMLVSRLRAAAFREDPQGTLERHQLVRDIHRKQPKTCGE